MADVTIKFDGDSSALDASINRVDGSLREVGKTGQEAGKQASDGMASIAVGTGIGVAAANLLTQALTAAAGAAKRLVGEAIRYADQLDDMSERTGMTVAQTAALGRIAASTGTDLGAIEAAIVRLNLVIGDSINGSKSATESLSKLGLSARALAEMSVEDRLVAVGAALRGIENDARRAAVSQDVLGRGAHRVGEALAEASVSIKAMSKVLKESGIEESTADVVEAKHAWDSLVVSLKEAAIAAVAAASRTAKAAASAATTGVAGAGEEAGTKAALAGGMKTPSGPDAMLALMEADKQALANVDALQAKEVAAAQAIIAARQAVPPLPPMERDGIDVALEMADAIGSDLAAAWQLAGTAARDAAYFQQQATAQAKAGLAELQRDLDAAKGLHREALIAEADTLAKRAELIRQFREQDLLAEDEQHLANLEKMTAAKDAELVTLQQYNQMVEAETQRHEDQQTLIKKTAADAQERLEKSKLDAISGFNQRFFGNLATLMNTKNRQMFEIGKAAAIAQAMISTYVAAAEGISWGMKNGGPYVAAAVAAATIAAGLAQVANIASTKFGGGGGGDSGGGGGALAAAGTGASQLGPAQQAPRRNIQISISGSRFSREDVEDLVQQIKDAEEDGIR